MPRARNIKPGFFANELLAEMDFGTRLLFIGLWTIADRSGRLEDRPKRIKMQLFPADDLDVDASLDRLADAGFVKRYQAGADQYLEVVNFGKHQSPHIKEPASVLPAPSESGASTVQAPDENHASRADSGFPITDSLIADSGLRVPFGESGANAPAPRAKRATSVPENFTVQDDDYAWATSKGLGREVVDLETEKFLLHYQAGGKPMKDWRAAWRNWMLKVPEFRRQPATVNSRASPSGVNDVKAAFAEFRARTNGAVETEDAIDIPGELRP